jgi:hypothetical protein
MSVRRAFLSLKSSSKLTRIALALAVAGGVGSLVAACSAGHDDSEAQYQEVVQIGRDRLPFRLYQK